jgi:hydrolase family protein
MAPTRLPAQWVLQVPAAGDGTRLASANMKRRDSTPQRIRPGCCPRFHPESWNNQTLHFDNKPFVKASTISLPRAAEYGMPTTIGRSIDHYSCVRLMCSGCAKTRSGDLPRRTSMTAVEPLRGLTLVAAREGTVTRTVVPVASAIRLR